MSEGKKFTEEELKKVKEIQESYFDIQNKFGQLSLARLRTEQQLEAFGTNEDNLRKQFSKIQDDEKTFLDGITEKYGEGSLDPDTGIFTSNK
jgi:hypothetical protein